MLSAIQTALKFIKGRVAMWRCGISRSVSHAMAAIFILTICVSTADSAGVPNLINYQGMLADGSGQPVPDGAYQITFRIYTAPSGGTQLWTSGAQSITLSGGRFSYLLGSNMYLPVHLFESDTVRYLGITVGTDPEIVPRTRLVTVPYSFQSKYADTSGYAVFVVDGSVTDASIAAGADIDPSKIDGTAMVLSSSSQTVDGFVNFTGPVTLYDRVFKSSVYGVKIGTAVAQSPDDAMVQIERNVSSSTYKTALEIDFQNSTSGGLYGLKSEVEHTTAAVGGSCYAIYGHATSDGSVRAGVSVLAECQNASHTSGNSYGVSASAYDGANAYGIYAYAGSATNNYAGYFSGNVNVTGTLSKGGGSFKIDHPLDPENKYLQHSFVESPDMMNIYNGNAALDSRGEAEIELPKWFEELNRDFRYQLTAIGAPGPNLYVAEEVRGNRFRIAGGEPGMKVSWQVTGIRKDRWAEANRIQVEVEKRPEERGKYLHPDVYGQPIDQSVDYESLKPILDERAARLENR